jgi:hypothetical protein
MVGVERENPQRRLRRGVRGGREKDEQQGVPPCFSNMRDPDERRISLLGSTKHEGSGC